MYTLRRWSKPRAGPQEAHHDSGWNAEKLVQILTPAPNLPLGVCIMKSGGPVGHVKFRRHLQPGTVQNHDSISQVGNSL